jgi:hypothetical protein
MLIPSIALQTGYKYYGLNRGTHEGKAGLWYREWAPGAKVSFVTEACQYKNALHHDLQNACNRMALYCLIIPAVNTGTCHCHLRSCCDYWHLSLSLEVLLHFPTGAKFIPILRLCVYHLPLSAVGFGFDRGFQ